MKIFISIVFALSLASVVFLYFAENTHNTGKGTRRIGGQSDVGKRYISVSVFVAAFLAAFVFLTVRTVLYYIPQRTIIEPAGVVKSIMPSGNGGSVLTTESRRYLVWGTWPTLEGVSVETRRPEGRLYGVSFPWFLYETPKPVLCVVGADTCSTIQN